MECSHISPHIQYRCHVALMCASLSLLVRVLQRNIINWLDISISIYERDIELAYAVMEISKLQVWRLACQPGDPGKS